MFLFQSLDGEDNNEQGIQIDLSVWCYQVTVYFHFQVYSYFHFQPHINLPPELIYLMNIVITAHH